MSQQNDKSPTVIHSGRLKIGDLEIEVLMLDNGQRIIPEADFMRALEWLGIQDESIIAEFRHLFEDAGK